MLVPSPPLPSPTVRPTVMDVSAYAEDQIRQATAALWPDELVVLAEHVPSVTGYVRRLRVGERDLYAKVSVLGVSLVSLLRGTRGDWPAVLRQEREYATRTSRLAAREAAQLRFLAGLERPRVSPLAGTWRSVLITEAVPGPTLTDRLLARPQDTAALFAGTLEELRTLRHPTALRLLGPSEVIAERSIAGTFRRKFNPGTANLPQLVAERCPTNEYDHVVESLSRTVARLHRLRRRLEPTPTALVYGDLKPDHVIYPKGPRSPVLLDPGLLRANTTADTAKLLSRTVLALVAQRPEPATARQVLEGVDRFAGQRLTRLSRAAGTVWLREVLAMWLMDTTNITVTYLSAPAELPLPDQARLLIHRVSHVCRLLDAASDAITSGTALQKAWALLLEHATGAAT